jgi:hypothetical protein
LPWVLAALLLRAAIPMGPAGTAMAAAMCSSQGMTETVEIPGQPTPAHCDYCLIPAAAAPPTLGPGTFLATPAALLPHRAHEAPVSRFALERTQIPRAPPLV